MRRVKAFGRAFLFMEKELTEEQKEEQRERELELSDIREVIKTPAGRRFYWRIMSEGKIFSDPNVPNDNGYETKVNVGRQQVGRWALNELMKADDDAYRRINNERAARIRRKEKILEEKMKLKEKDILSTGA